MLCNPSIVPSEYTMAFKQIVILIFLLLTQGITHAHDVQTAGFTLHLNGEKSYLDINLSQYGIEQALQKRHPELDFKTLANKAFKELLVSYLKQNIKLASEGEQYTLGGGLIKLGSHQSKVKFKIKNVNSTPEVLTVNIPAFAENPRQSNFFTLKADGVNQRVKLSVANDFEARVTLKNG